jgi:hypothetical protein
LAAISHHVAALRRETSRPRVVHGSVHIAPWYASSCGLLHANLVPLSNLAFQLLPPDLTALSERDVQRLGANHLVVHLCNRLASLFGRGETHEAKAFRGPLLVMHDLTASDSTERFELGAKFFILDVILQVLDVKVDTRIFAELLHLGLLVGPTQLFLTLSLLLGSGDEEFLPVDLGVV